MLTVEEALDQILSHVRPLGTELVEHTAALGRVLAEPVVSRRELPPWPNSSMDGYAVRADDTRAGGVELVVVGRIIAGSLPARTLRTGEAMRIFTGAPLPAEVGLLAALGHARVRVHRRPRVAVLSTGNELADLGTEPGP